MELKLNITKEQFNDLHDAHLGLGESYEDILFNTFYHYLQKPTMRITELMNTGKYEDFKSFAELLDWYFKEMTDELEEVSKTYEAYGSDPAMAKVIEKLRVDHLPSVLVITSLYDEFKKHHKGNL